MPEITEKKVTARGPKTTEFWVSVISSGLTWLTALVGALPTEQAAKITGFIAAIYAVARGLAKIG